jgi:CRP-like cAMP-binding protein
MSTADVLCKVWLFQGLTEDQLNAISSFTFQTTFDPGETIVEQAHTGNGLYIVLSGHVEVVKGLGTENARRAQNRKRYCAGQG